MGSIKARSFQNNEVGDLEHHIAFLVYFFFMTYSRELAEQLNWHQGI